VPTSVDSLGWMRKAKCREVDIDPNVFHPERAPGRTAVRLRAELEAQAVAVCGVGSPDECPVWRQCRAYAFARNERFGVWGGLTEDQRHCQRDHPKRNI
jgi:WhiB family redox-sensing transcriptional regulator